MKKPNQILELTLDFAVEILEFCELLKSQKQYEIANQLLRSGTSTGAHVFEAQHPESKADFIHKMKGAIKEASEASFWLQVCERSRHLPSSTSLKLKVESIIALLSRIIIASRTS